MVVSAAGGDENVRVRFYVRWGRVEGRGRGRGDERGDGMAGGKVGSRGAPG